MESRSARVLGRVQILSALRHRDYRLFWFGQLASVTGFQMLILAQGWLVYELTGSTLQLGLTGLFTAVPAITLTLLGGVVADKVDRRRLLILTQLLQAVLLAVLAILTTMGAVQVWHVWLNASLISAIGAFDQPSRQAIFPALIDQRDMMNAVALNSSIWQGTRVVGPAIAGGIIAWVGAAPVFYLTTAGFVAFAMFLAMIRMPRIEQVSSGNVAQEMLAGLRFIRDNSLFGFLLGMTFFNSFFGMSYVFLMPVFAKDILAAGASGLGFLLAAQGVGGLIGTVVVASLGDFRRKGRLIIAAAVAFGASIVLFALSPWYLVSAALVFVAGITLSLYMVSTQSTMQLLVPDVYRGRVMGIWGLTHTFIMPLGGMQAGVVASLLGAPIAVAIGGAAVILFALVGAGGRAQIRDLGEEQITQSATLPR